MLHSHYLIRLTSAFNVSFSGGVGSGKGKGEDWFSADNGVGLVHPCALSALGESVFPWDRGGVGGRHPGLIMYSVF